MRPTSRGTGVLLALLVLALACAPSSLPPPAAAPSPPAAASTTAVPASAQPAAEAAPAVTVHLGILNSTTDAGLYIAEDKGYFQQQGLTLDMIPFDSAARMVAALGTGQLDVGAGSHSAGLFNAVARGIPMKLVADKGSAPPGHGFQVLMFRRDLVESGELQSTRDLRGKPVAISARGVTAEAMLSRWLQQGGLTPDDVELVELGFPDHASALAGRAVQAVVNIEPFVTRIEEQGLATTYQRVDELYPGYLLAEVIYSGPFAGEHVDAARRFMVAYLRGVRDYNDAFERGDPVQREEAIAILARNTAVKDPALYARMRMPGLDPNGRMNVGSIAEDQELWLAQGRQDTRVDLSEVIDHSFVDYAVAQLGPYPAR
jgi:NitT/TauT family transport system substrate-binding protein